MYQRQTLDGHGDGAIATQSIRTGICILKCNPTSAVPLDMSTTCAYCFKPGVRRCGLCKVFHYCNRNCQLTDWAVHGIECKYLAQYLNENPLTPTLLLAIRLLRSSESIKSINHLVSHLDGHLQDKLQDYHAMSTLVLTTLHRMKLKIDFPTIDAVMNLFGQFNCNAFTLCTLEQVPVGIGMYPDAALLNHSCAPNCIITFHGRQLQIRTLRPIAKGEELTISYIELMASRDTRQEELRSSYFFTCQCSRCRTEESHESTQILCQEDQEEIIHLHALADEYEAKQDTRRAVDMRRQALDLAQKIYGPHSVEMSLAAETLANLITSTEHSPHQTRQDIQVARDNYELVLKSQARLYQPLNMEPFRGLCTLKMGRLLFQDGQAHAAIPFLQDACAFLAITHGDECDLVRNAIELLHQAQRDTTCQYSLT